MVSELLIEMIVKLTQETCALSFSSQGLTINALPSLSKVCWADGWCCKFPHLFDDYNMLSNKPSQSLPLDVAPMDVPTRGSGESISLVVPQANGSAPPYTSEKSFHKSDLHLIGLGSWLVVCLFVVAPVAGHRVRAGGVRIPEWGVRVLAALRNANAIQYPQPASTYPPFLSNSRSETTVGLYVQAAVSPRFH